MHAAEQVKIGAYVMRLNDLNPSTASFSTDLWVWTLLLLGAPAFIARLRANRNGYGTLLSMTALAVAAAFSLGQTDDIGAQSFWRCSFAAFWTVVYLVGAAGGACKLRLNSATFRFAVRGWRSLTLCFL